MGLGCLVWAGGCYRDSEDFNASLFFVGSWVRRRRACA